MKNNAYDNKLLPKRSKKELDKLKVGDIILLAFKDCKEPTIHLVTADTDSGTLDYVYTQPLYLYLTAPGVHNYSLNTDRWKKIDTLKKLIRRTIEPDFLASLKRHK